MITLNFWPILVASLASFALGSLWYSPILFGREWLTMIKMREADIANYRHKSVWIHYFTQFLVTIVTFCVLAFMMGFLGLGDSGNGAFLGLLAWLGFIFPTAISSLLWKKDPIMLVLIETINTLLTLMIGGAIIGAWR